MIFEALKVTGYGCLRGEYKFAPDKVNLAVADNETGKSTLVSAILAAFYGIVEDERVTRDPRPRRKNVLPWTKPEEFGVTLDFCVDKIHWRIQRDFNSGLVKLIDRDSVRDHTDEYYKGHGGYRIGEGIIGLSCADFLKSFFLIVSD